MNRKKKRGWLEISLFLLILILLILIVFTLKPTLIGLSVYEETGEKIWDFSNPAAYLYNAQLLNLSTREAQLIPAITTKTWTTTEINEISLSAAAQVNTNNGNTEDRLAKLLTLDGQAVEIEKNNHRLDFTFSNFLANGDIISLYLKKVKDGETEVYLCVVGISCESSGYGIMQYTGMDKWYNLTLLNLNSATGSFSLDSAKKLKIDSLKAFHTETSIHTQTNAVYPALAEIETTDFAPLSLKRWNLFNSDKELREQQINYFYSVDSGANWQPLTSGQDLSLLNSPQIRLKAQFISNQKETPQLQQLKIGYTSELSYCKENWRAHFSPCLENNTQLKRYIDLNNCGTTSLLPADNNTIVFCDYCTPHLINSSGEWIKMGECSLQNLQLQQKTILQTDNNNCGEVGKFTFVEEQTIGCDYCLINNCTGARTENNLPKDNWIIFDFKEETGSFLEIKTVDNDDLDLSVVEYNWTALPLTEAALPLNKYWEIGSSSEQILWAQIKLYYTEEEIFRANINEESLGGFYYNESSSSWEELPSAVNLEENYVSINTTHFSTYGIFGQTLEKDIPIAKPASTSSSSSGGGEGGGSSRKIILTQTGETILPVGTTSPEISVNEQEESIAQLTTAAKCNYVLEISLPEKVSLLQKERFEGEITNRGNCLIQRLNLYLNPDLEAEVNFTPQTIIELAPEENVSFVLIRKSKTDPGIFSFLTGNAVVDQVISKKVSGKISLEGLENQGVLFTQDLPLELEIFSSEKVAKTVKIVLPGFGGILFIFVLILFLVKKKKLLKK